MRRTGSGTVLILLLLGMSSSFFNLQETGADPQPQPQLENDKRIYRLGQNVTIILTNIGNETLWIGGYPPWQISTFPEKESVYPKFFATLAWELDPGENDTFVWNQIDEFTLPPSFVEAGKYIIEDTNGWGLSCYFSIVEADLIVPVDYSTIQKAINNANERDTIFVGKGTYCENVVVNKTVSLVGECRDSTIIDGNGTFVTILHVTVNDVIIMGFTIQNDTPIHCLEGGGVFITNSNGSRVVNNVVKDTQYGINLKNSMNSIVAGNTLTKNDVGIQFLDNSSNNIVYHNNFFDNDLSTNNILGGPNIWDNGCEGNYWSDYNGTDTSIPPDGIGDTELPWEGVDYFPLMNPYWNPTDINHDLKVDIRDLAFAAKAYGSEPGDSNWNPHADITGQEYLVPDGKVDMRDIALIAVNFGEVYQ